MNITFFLSNSLFSICIIYPFYTPDYAFLRRIPVHSGSFVAVIRLNRDVSRLGHMIIVRR